MNIVLSKKKKDLVFWQVGILFFCRMITGFIGIDSIVYLEDVVTLLMLLCLAKDSYGVVTKRISLFVLFIFVYWTINFILGTTNDVFSYFYEIRQFFRFYIILIYVTNYFEKKDFDKIINIIDKIIIIQFILSEFQIYILGVESLDAVGGILGTTYGYANVGSHMILLLNLIVTIYKFLEKKEDLWWSFTKIVMIISLAVQIEIKSFVFEVIILLTLMLCYYGKLRIRTGTIIVLGIVLLPFMAKYYITNFNYDFADTETIVNYLESGYAGNVDAIGRFDGFQKIFVRIFNYNKRLLFFGYGTGSSGAHEFITKYSNMNLGYFTYAKLFFDFGIIGVAIYFSVYLIAIIKALKMRIKCPGYGAIILAVGISCIYWSFYGNVMESDIGGYLNYILLGIAFVPVDKFVVAEKRKELNQESNIEQDA